MISKDHRNDHHKIGVLLSPEIVGKTLFSHSAACEGRLIRLFVTEVGYTHTNYRTEDGASGCFATGNQGKGERNWEAIDLATAEEVLKGYWAKKLQEIDSLRAFVQNHMLSGRREIQLLEKDPLVVVTQ